MNKAMDKASDIIMGQITDKVTDKEKPNLYMIFAIFILSLVNMQDGFDILAISYAAQAITKDWGISSASLGIVFSAGLFGMMLGALFLAPLADRVGRKLITMMGLAASGSGMLVAMAATNIEILVIGRVLTGLGVGAILASLNTLVSEYSGPRYRVVCIAMFQIGFPVGAFLSGFAVAWLLDIGTWRYVFAFGAFTSFFFIPIIMLLPESTAFLAKQNGKDALAKINQINARFGRAALTELPQTEDQRKSNFFANIKTLLSPQYAGKTIFIWLAFFLVMSILYFLLSWTPKIVIDLGFTDDQGNRAGRLINLYGMVGIILLGLLSVKFKPSALVSFYMFALMILLLSFSLFGSQYGHILLAVSLFGVFIHGSMIGLYSTVPALYPSSLRATGTGWAIGISRSGAVLGPALAGFLFEAGYGTALIFQIFALPALLAALAAYFLWLKSPEPNKIRDFK